MARKPLPYYPFYVDAFDEGVLSMNLAEVGLYILALGHSWKHGSIPSDPAELARLIRRKPSEVRKAWPAVKPKWTPSADAKTLTNARQEEERVKAYERAEKASNAAYQKHAKEAARDPAKPLPDSHSSSDASSAHALLRGSESESSSGFKSGVSETEKPEGYLAEVSPRGIAQELWSIHPTPSKFGFVEASIFNELQKTVMTPEKFREAILASLQAWAEYWREAGRMATGLDNWVASGDFARKPPTIPARKSKRLSAEEIAAL